MLSPSEVKKIDKSGLHKIYEDWYVHCVNAFQTEVKVPDISHIKEVVFAGMGGSATPGDVLQDWLRDDIKIPLYVVKDYHLPRFVGRDTFVLAVSCSGNTEETLSVVHEAIKAGCKVATISSGGLLEEISLKNNIVHNKIAFKSLSRASFPYLFYVSVKILSNYGLLKGLEGQILNSIRLVKDISKHVSIDSPTEGNISKKLASKLCNSLPFVYGSSLNRAVAVRFKNVLNENSKMHVVVDVQPELCHNEIVAWEGAKEKAFKALFLRYEREPPEVKARFEIIGRLIRDAGFETLEAWSWGTDRLSKIISLLYILDFASLYVAVMRGFDPSLTASIDKVKRGLKSRLDFVNRYVLKGRRVEDMK
ncbi:MAG: bifunctional phosphoglucose/phosphomannose isomerase [Nitrososphaerales archaeon]